MRAEFDNRDGELLQARIAKWGEREGCRVGDYVRMPNGDLLRFTHDWDDSIQTTCPKLSGDQSFYFSEDGYLSYSGSLDPAISKSKLYDTFETKDGHIWFFHHNERRAHNGVYATIPCRVYEYRG